MKSLPLESAEKLLKCGWVLCVEIDEVSVFKRNTKTKEMILTGEKKQTLHYTIREKSSDKAGLYVNKLVASKMIKLGFEAIRVESVYALGEIK
ncbi:hypothetical protein BI036_gp085 [Morganella phage vB_MmoM_MP1]|uniref:Uncharacterized protein n=1 Tax=Morganella phage vB_MmoM_MP1 TaxID=1852628 RepID=A0A192YCH7_9CAUD|nr:hypothetical protein BI036_gp085 [Morganella phage vB_MmoM_MP1]ANM46581.1 hypothetical protein MP1_gp0084 [Morganella phage vB_MmoM_MP1]